MANQRFRTAGFRFHGMINTGPHDQSQLTLPRVTRSSASGPGLPKVW